MSYPILSCPILSYPIGLLLGLMVLFFGLRVIVADSPRRLKGPLRDIRIPSSVSRMPGVRAIRYTRLS